MLSLFAPHSLVDTVHQSEGGSHWADPHSDTAEVNEGSAEVGVVPINTLATRALSAAKLVGPPCLTQSLWEVSGRTYLRLIPHSSAFQCIPVTDDYASVLRDSVENTSQKTQFSAGCRLLANACYPELDRVICHQ